MRTKTLATLAVTLALVLSACSSTKGVPPIRSEFMDIPLPGGLEYIADQSAVIESETVRAARLMYSSKFELGSLVLSIQEGLLGGGWRLVRTTKLRCTRYASRSRTQCRGRTQRSADVGPL